jgi:hypothetical protein
MNAGRVLSKHGPFVKTTNNVIFGRFVTFTTSENVELCFVDHRCTVVGNPGGVSLVFLANYFEGGTWGCEKIRGGRVLLHFYVEVFQKSL